MILELKNISKNYYGQCALNNVSFSINKRGCYGVLGPNGAGKSTLLNIIAGYIAPSPSCATNDVAPNGAE